MKTPIVLLTALLFCSAWTAAGDLELDTPHVAVFGTAEIEVTPNQLIWSVNVKNKDKELPTAASKHTATVQKVLSFLKGLGIEEKKIQTSSMQFGEDWKTVNREHVKVGYFASTDVSFTISNLGLYQQIWFGLANIDGVSIRGTQYDHTDRIEYQNESREKAVLAAREKADKLARTLNTQILEPLKIEEVPTASHFISNYSNVAFDRSSGSTGSSLAPGQITISTKVKVFFRMMGRQ